MKRDEWTVLYNGRQLSEASNLKKEYHSGRLTWWKQKKEDVIAKIRAEGISVTDSIVDELGKLGYSNTSPGMGGPVVQIDAALQAHLREAQGKVQAHESMISQYDSWLQMMSARPACDTVFDLTHGDWMFFFGK